MMIMTMIMMMMMVLLLLLHIVITIIVTIIRQTSNYGRQRRRSRAGKAEALRGLRDLLNTNCTDHDSVGRLKERRVEKWE